jgi:hypothetical protein
MRRIVLSLALLASSALAVAACVTTSVGTIDDDAGTTADGSTGDGGGCPQFDLQTDPKHCGSCTNACSATQVCSAGKCKGSCDAPLIKCAGDSGSCIDITKDPKNCGSCGSPCPLPDGGPSTGTGNPDAGLPPSDAGVSPGWYLGTATCSNSSCGITCPNNGSTLCSDNLCWDTQFAHDHCGNCTTACAASTEHCNKGKCCPIGQANCNGTCTDVLSDKNNCGGCGTVCSGGTPNCVQGTCAAGPPPATFSQTFTSGQLPTAQCTAWNTFRASLGNSYTSVTIKGTFDSVGITCTTPSVVNGLAAALKNGTDYFPLSCNGHVWSNCNRTGQELWLDPPSVCSGANCPNPGYLLRPCFGSANIWGGVNTATCSSPTQTVTLTFQ